MSSNPTALVTPPKRKLPTPRTPPPIRPKLNKGTKKRSSVLRKPIHARQLNFEEEEEKGNETGSGTNSTPIPIVHVIKLKDRSNSRVQTCKLEKKPSLADRALFHFIDNDMDEKSNGGKLTDILDYVCSKKIPKYHSQNYISYIGSIDASTQPISYYDFLSLNYSEMMGRESVHKITHLGQWIIADPYEQWVGGSDKAFCFHSPKEKK